MFENLHKMKLEDLVRKAQRGEERAFVELYRRYYDSIYYFALKLSHNEADAKDITQETFIQAQEALSTLKEPKFYKAWLNRIAFSKATRLFSKNSHYQFFSNDSEFSDHIQEERAYMDPLKTSRFQSDQEVLQSYIAKLSKEQQIVLHLMYFEQFTMQEIAEILQIPIGTVKSRLYVAKARLNEELRKYENTYGVPITFKEEALSGAIASLFAKECTKLTTSMNFSLPLQKLRTAFSMCSTKVIAICSCMVFTGIGSYAWLAYSSSQSAEPDPILKNKISYSLQPFPKVTYQGTVFERADHSYYALLRFAHCEEELQEKAVKEIQEIDPLYQELKAYGGIYYDKLVDANWANAYEKIIK